MTQTTAALIVCQFFLHMQLKHKPAATDLLNKMDEYSMVVCSSAAPFTPCEDTLAAPLIGSKVLVSSLAAAVGTGADMFVRDWVSSVCKHSRMEAVFNRQRSRQAAKHFCCGDLNIADDATRGYSWRLLRVVDNALSPRPTGLWFTKAWLSQACSGQN